MNIYFFCDRTPDPKMLNELGSTITEKFKGTINNIQRRGNQITFSEAMYFGGLTINVCYVIPAKSIVIVEPILLQPWLKAGIAKLLILQTAQQICGWGILGKYCGLLQVHRIEAATFQSNSSLPLTPISSVTVFEPKTRSWHRMPNFEHSESVWVTPFVRPQVASASTTCNDIMPHFTLTDVTQKRRGSPWSALEVIWLTTIGLAIFICLAIGLRLKQPSPYPEVKHSNFRIPENAQPIRLSTNLGSTN